VLVLSLVFVYCLCDVVLVGLGVVSVLDEVLDVVLVLVLVVSALVLVFWSRSCVVLVDHTHNTHKAEHTHHIWSNALSGTS
jgi:hypothetical protein